MTNYPFYIIEFSASNCFIDLRVNDVVVKCFNVEGQLGTTIPVNQAIVEPGPQHVTYNILPLSGETSLDEEVDFSASIWLYDASQKRIEKIEKLNDYAIPRERKGMIPLYKHETVFTAYVPYHIDAWQNSVNLKDMDAKVLREMVDKEFNPHCSSKS